MAYIYVLEFGGQYTDLIVRRVKEMGLDARRVKSSTPLYKMRDARGIILSGGPKFITKPGAYSYDPELFKQKKVPVLGICYGMQVLANEMGAELHGGTREYGRTGFIRLADDPLLHGLGPVEIVCMNHGDSVTPNENLIVIGYSEKGVPAAIRSKTGPYSGVQFHPEVYQTVNGKTIMRNFLERECGCETMETKFDPNSYVEEAIARLKDEVGSRNALLYASGGVDSTVAAKLALKAGCKINLVHLDMGFERENEAHNTSEMLGRLFDRDVYVHDRSKWCIEQLRGFSDSQEKRHAFGYAYARTKHEIEQHLDLHDSIVIDGSLSTDFRESGKEAGDSGEDSGTVAVVKDHHNPWAHLQWEGAVSTPLDRLTKEQVRAVAKALGFPDDIIRREPFPGPGLSVRYITAAYPMNGTPVEQVRGIARANGLYGYILPRKGVGLKGDGRSLGYVALLTGERDWPGIRKAGKRIIEDCDVTRVLYSPTRDDFTDEQLGTAVNYPMDRAGLDTLRRMTSIVNSTMREFGVYPSQTPVITFGGQGGRFVVVRDFDSTDFRTGRPLEKPEEFPWECIDEIHKRLGRDKTLSVWATLNDVSDKPGGTTEFE